MNQRLNPRSSMATAPESSAPIIVGAACALAMFAALMLGNPEALEKVQPAQIAPQAMSVAVGAPSAPKAPIATRERSARPYIRGTSISIESQAEHFDASERKAAAAH